MEAARHGQRLLMALVSEEQHQDRIDGLPGFDTALPGLDSVLPLVAGLLCLLTVVFLCTCAERKPKASDEQQAGLDNNKTVISMDGKAMEMRTKPSGEAGVLNGGQALNNSSPGQTDHLRQASTSSGPPGALRPTSLRELPEPPVSAARHSRNTSNMSGVELPPVPDDAGQEERERDDGRRATNAEGDQVAVGNDVYAYPKHVAPRGGVGEEKKIKSNSDGYDHLGQASKPQRPPTDYEGLSPPGRDSERTPLSETGQGADNHYSLVRERTYDVVKDVKRKAGKLYDPYSTVSDKDVHEGEVYRPTKEEDPYNHIGDSDGGVPSAFIRHLRETSDATDPYSTVQDGSGGTVPYTKSTDPVSFSAINDHHHDYDDTEEEEEEAAEYAVVLKTRGGSSRSAGGDGVSGPRGSHASSDYAFPGAGAMPPEPPRLYNAYEDEDETYSVTSPTGEKREHQYSKVTARESLASMSARNALNPYELVQDLPENTYATVEGGSGDGVVLRHVDSDDNNSNRNSQNSDTYAEIAISGGGLSSSIISNSSNNAGGNNSHAVTATSNTSANSTMMNPGGGVVLPAGSAPAPPSLDSLHLMTKSQTSSEGDRHLATPEDTGLDMAGLPPLPAWGDRTFGQEGDEDSGGSVAEDGYSTLKRVTGAAGAVGGSQQRYHQPNAALPDIPVEKRGQAAGKPPSSLPLAKGRQSDQVTVRDEESGETTQLSPGYTTVKDFLSSENLAAEIENDPNYESVDEARAKLRLLYRTERMVGEDGDGSGAGAGGSNGGATPAKKNVTVVKILHSVKTSSTSSVTRTSSSSLPHTPERNSNSNNNSSNSSSLRKEEDTVHSRGGVSNKRQRRPNHDYEELDLSPPTSPSTSAIPSSSPFPRSPSPPSSQGAGSPSVSLAAAKERLARSHMYEEVSEIRAKTSLFGRSDSGGGGGDGGGSSSNKPSTVAVSAVSSQSLPNAPSLSSSLSTSAASTSSSRPGEQTNNLSSAGTASGSGSVNNVKGSHGNSSGAGKDAPPQAKFKPGSRRNSRGDGGNPSDKNTGSGVSPYTGTRV